MLASKLAPARFSFIAATHTYLDAETGEVLPSVTQMLKATGWVDDSFYTPESAARGTRVHDLCTAHDFGLMPEGGDERGYLLAYLKACEALRPVWAMVEVAMVHRHYRFAGRPDRVGQARGVTAVVEIKSGAPVRATAIQCALQAILVASEGGLLASAYGRLAIYLKPNGKFTVAQFTDRHDFDIARDIIRKVCGR